MDQGLKDLLLEAFLEDEARCVLALDAGGVVRACSRGAAALPGCPPEGLVGRGLDSLLAEPSECRRLLDAARRGAAVRDVEALLAGGEGPGRTVLLSARALGPGFFVTIETVAPGASYAPGAAGSGIAPAAAQEALARLERFSAVGRMAAAFAHEMRTPLHVISSTAELELESLPEDDGLRRSLDMILRNARYAAGSVQALLDFAKAGRSHLKRCSLNEVVRTAMSLSERLCKARGIEADVRLGEVPGLMLDEQHVRAVVHNLAVNGIEAMPGKGVLTVRTGVRDGGVFLEVRDTGLGMSAEVLAKAGSAFFTTKENGTGLGLYLARRILAEHGAVLSLSSEEGRGTAATVTFKGPVS